MSLNLSLNTKQLVHHGAEAAAFIALGTYASSSLSTACIAYGLGKVTYLGTRVLLNLSAPKLSLDANRILSWGTSLLAGGSILHITLSETKGRSASALTTMLTTASVAAASIGFRLLAYKSFKHFSTMQTPLPSPQQSAQKKEQ